MDGDVEQSITDGLCQLLQDQTSSAMSDMDVFSQRLNGIVQVSKPSALV